MYLGNTKSNFTERLSYPGEIGNSGREKCLDGKQAVKNGECF